MIPWGIFPFNKELEKLTEQMQPSEVHDYVNKMMRNFMQSNMFQSPPLQTKDSNTPSEYNILETFDHVYIKYVLPKPMSIDELRIYHTSNKVIIENLVAENKRVVISLPYLVKKKGAIAQIMGNMLEIKMLKNDDTQYTEVALSEK